MGTVEPQVASGQDVKVVSSGQIVANAQSQEVTDGFHLVIDALKLNGIDTIFGLPGIRSPTSPAWHRPKACA